MIKNKKKEMFCSECGGELNTIHIDNQDSHTNPRQCIKNLKEYLYNAKDNLDSSRYNINNKIEELQEEINSIKRLIK